MWVLNIVECMFKYTNIKVLREYQNLNTFTIIIWCLDDDAYLLFTIHLDIPNCENDDGCHDNATCTDANGSYTCVCKVGFAGDGFTCTGNISLFDYVFVKAVCRFSKSDSGLF